MMEEEYGLIRSPSFDTSQLIEKLKYNVLRFSLDSIDISLVETGNAIHLQVQFCSSNSLRTHSLVHFSDCTYSSLYV